LLALLGLLRLLWLLWLLGPLLIVDSLLLALSIWPLYISGLIVCSLSA
jgi:hypothetical protein